MIREPAAFIAEYYESIKEKYPHLSQKQVDDICRNSFRLVKSEMQKGSLKKIRLKYFGSFVVNKGRAKGLLNKTVKMHREGKVDASILDYIRKIVKEFLKREYNEDVSCDEFSQT